MLWPKFASEGGFVLRSWPSESLSGVRNGIDG